MLSPYKMLLESLRFAFNALVVNKLRTLLSLTGVTIGIFSIISVFTLVDSLEREIRSSVEELGDQVIYIQKWPWAFGGDYPWWDYINRPEASINELESIAKRSELAAASGYQVDFRKIVKYRTNSIEDQQIQAITPDYNQVRTIDLAQGRYFTQQEFTRGNSVCLIGDYVAYVLFGLINPIGKTLRIDGRSTTVVGVFRKEGESMIGMSLDEIVLVPVNYAKTMIDLKSKRLSPSIYVKAKNGVSLIELKDELTIIMRALRGLKPRQDDNFALNEVSILSRGFDEFFGFINLVGMVIGGFSILVGGFGIANIMFVSVKERTNIIGIQKALGAKRSFILTQFLAEAIILCLVGGGVGLLVIFLVGVGMTFFTDFQVMLTTKNMLLGFGISAIIGLISGFVPALSAAKLDPVEAIRR